MENVSYQQTRGKLEAYFDRTAADAWAQLTSDKPVGKIRATVRAGRDRMRATLLGYLPADLSGARVLDAGCGTGALAVEAARRGARVTAIDISPTLVKLARERAPKELGKGSIDFRVGDMTDAALGQFDHVVAMDSLIHYRPADMLDIICRLSARAEQRLAFTFAPRTTLLAMMHLAGKAFPRGNRSPAIEPIAPARLRRLIASDPRLRRFTQARSERVQSAFYISQTLELVRP